MTKDSPTLSVRLVWPFRAVSQELGFDADALWAQQGISAEDLMDPDTRVPLDVTQMMAGWVVEATGIGDYGIRAARAAGGGLFELPEYSARSQETLGDALTSVTRLLPLVSDAGVMSLESQGSIARVRFDPAPGLHPVSVEFTFAYMQIAARRYTGIEHLRPIEIRLAHEAPTNAQPHEDFFRCPVVFSSPTPEAILPIDQLALPLQTADSALGDLLDRIARQQLAEMEAGTDFIEQVRSLVSKRLSTDGAPVTSIADQLGITPRTLHRRLSEEGTTYRELSDEVKKGLAIAHLMRRELAVNEVAYLLGFSGVQAFHRAFKRWTGETPGSYRKKRR